MLHRELQQSGVREKLDTHQLTEIIVREAHNQLRQSIFTLIMTNCSEGKEVKQNDQRTTFVTNFRLGNNHGVP